MAIAEVFTKKRISEVRESDDVFDHEYRRRLEEVKTVQQLSDLIRDYEEFLPEGLQEFRDASDEARKELLFQKDRFLAHARRGQMLADPTEAAALFSPPMISMPRMMALTMMNDARKKGKTIKVTWGQVFLKLANEGMIQKLIRSQDNMYRRIIDLKKYAKGELDKIDMKHMPEDGD